MELTEVRPRKHLSCRERNSLCQPFSSPMTREGGFRNGDRVISGTANLVYISHCGRADETVSSHVFDEFDVSRTAAPPCHDWEKKRVVVWKQADGISVSIGSVPRSVS